MTKLRIFGTCLVVLALVGGTFVSAAEDSWQSLFDGKTLKGWKQEGGKATYVVKNGEIYIIVTPIANLNLTKN